MKITFASWQEDQNQEAGYRSVVIKVNGSPPEWFGVMCEDVNKFLCAIEKMGVEVLEETNIEQ